MTATIYNLLVQYCVQYKTTIVLCFHTTTTEQTTMTTTFKPGQIVTIKGSDTGAKYEITRVARNVDGVKLAFIRSERSMTIIEGGANRRHFGGSWRPYDQLVLVTE